MLLLIISMMPSVQILGLSEYALRSLLVLQWIVERLHKRGRIRIHISIVATTSDWTEFVTRLSHA